ncbi:MAG: cytochrome c biogenesis protein CcsA [Lysobacterales bacterium]
MLTVAAWVVFGILLLARWRLGLRGRRAAWLTLAGMALLLVGYFGVKLILAR